MINDSTKLAALGIILSLTPLVPDSKRQTALPPDLPSTNYNFVLVKSNTLVFNVSTSRIAGILPINSNTLPVIRVGSSVVGYLGQSLLD